jgi:lipopolysaccharide/colanic/teichoic acid biosynthesis glycosyltransferase
MSNRGHDYLASPTKRRLDILGGLLIGAAFAPAIAATATASAIDTRDNPFIRQPRVGQGRSSFSVLKIRTLRNSSDSPVTETFGTFDHRASRLGQIIREFGLDEMPQVANVIRGDMSLVGIRPLLEKDFDRMADVDPALFDDWQEAYAAHKPGLTGPGQLYRHHYRASTDEVYSESMRLDLNYVENASLRSDLALVATTPASLIQAALHTVENA